MNDAPCDPLGGVGDAPDAGFEHEAGDFGLGGFVALALFLGNLGRGRAAVEHEAAD